MLQSPVWDAAFDVVSSLKEWISTILADFLTNLCFHFFFKTKKFFFFLHFLPSYIVCSAAKIISAR